MLINCAVYQHGKKIGDIPLADIGRYKAEANSFVWVALKEPEAAELETIQREFGLHPLAVEDAQHGHQRPKMDEYGAALFVVLQLIDQKGHELVTGEVAIFVGPNYLVTVHDGHSRSVAELQDNVARNNTIMPDGPVALFHRVVDAMVDHYRPEVEKLEDRIDDLENLFGRCGGSGELGSTSKFARRRDLQPVVGPQPLGDIGAIVRLRIAFVVGWSNCHGDVSQGPNRK